MKITRLLLLVIAIVIISTFLTRMFYNSFIIENTYSLEMELKINDHFGLNADADAIKFGMLMPGTTGERAIFVNNSATYPLRVVILKSGYIADWVSVSETDFILGQQETRRVVFTVYAPKDAEFGKYTGKSKIIFKKTMLG